MEEESKRLLEIYAETRTDPILDKDVDALIAYLTSNNTTATNNNTSSTNSTNNNATTNINEKTPEWTNSQWESFSNVTIQTLRLCLDISSHHGILSDAQKKTIVFHGLLPLGSSNLSYREDAEARSEAGSKEVTVLKHALEVILSTAIRSTTDGTSTTSNNHNNNHNHNHNSNNHKNTILGIEMLLTPYLSRLQRHSTSIQPYLTQICHRPLQPMTAAALINAMNSFSASSHSSSSSSSRSGSSIWTQEKMISFLKNLFACLYELVWSKNEHQEYDSIPPLIYQICQLIPNHGSHSSPISGSSSGGISGGDISHHAAMILTSISSFLNYMLQSCGENDNDTNTNKNQETNHQEIHWTIFTSLNHLGNVLRSNPILPTVLLKILKGSMSYSSIPIATPTQTSSSSSSSSISPPPFRYLHMSPILLAMGLTMATYIPRMRDSTLECLKDLVMEESMIQMKRTKSDWFHALASILRSSKGVKFDKDGNSGCWMIGNGTEDENVQGKEQEWERNVKSQMEELQNGNNGNGRNAKDSYMLQCMKQLLSLTGASSHSKKRKSKDTNDNQNRKHAQMMHSNSDLYPVLVSLGFLLIDALKKDSVIPFSNPASQCVYTVQPIPTCTTTLHDNTNASLQLEAQKATARIGRSLLTHLFLFVGMGSDDEDVVIGNNGYASQASLNPLCKSILMTLLEKCCGMAPNAMEHSYLLRDIVFAKPEDGNEDDGVRDPRVRIPQSMGASILEESFLPFIIDSLSNIPGGGMPPSVALVSILPSLTQILKLAIIKRQRHRQKQNELEDHIDHCFLLAKKALFCTDVERRKVAIHLFTMLILLALEKKEYHGEDHACKALME